MLSEKYYRLLFGKVLADGMLKNGTRFSVLPTDDKWFGVTYKEDKPTVVESFNKLIEDAGIPLYVPLRYWLLIFVFSWIF